MAIMLCCCFFRRIISEVPWLIATKLSRMSVICKIGSEIWGLSPLKFGAKNVKILDLILNSLNRLFLDGTVKIVYTVP